MAKVTAQIENPVWVFSLAIKLANEKTLNIMNNMTKMTLAAVFTAAVATSAQAQYTAGDLLVGFIGNGSGNDEILNIGLVTSLYQGETWNVGYSSPTAFGVIGGNFPASTYYLTTADGNGDPTQVGTASQGHNLSLNASTLYTQNAGLANVGGHVSVAASGTYSWTTFVDNSQASGNTFGAHSQDPVDVSASSTAYFYSVANSGTATADSFFTYSDGVLEFGTAPEPATYGLLAGLGLLALSIRRQFAKA
jgi:hypothetical protein